MPFNEQLPEWNAPGVEPPASKKTAGWDPGEKPPADYWNWQMNRTYKALQELQQKAAEKEEVESVAQAADQAWGQAVLARSIAELHAARHATGGPDEITPEDIGAIPISAATSAATPNTIVQRDPAGRFKAAAPSASDDVARKAEVDAIASDYQLSRKFRTTSIANEKRKLLSIALGTYQNIVFKLTVTMTEPTFFAFWEGLIEVRRETGDVTYEVREYTENKVNNNGSTTMILKFYVDQSTRSAFVYIERGAWGAQGTNIQVAYQILGATNQPTIVFENELVTDYQGTEVTVITR